MPRKNQHHPHGEAVRLQAFLAHSGVASRRHAEALIAGGRVFVNGVSVTAPGTKITPGVDHVEVEGQPVEVQPITWIALHKPKGYVTSRDDPYGRKTVYDLLPEKFHGLFHVGRLDRDSEGILLLTNDGVLANRMLHPSFGITKEYWADVEGKPTAEQMHRIVEEGVEDEGEHLRAESIRRLHQTGENEHRLSILLREGKKREVRRMLAALGHPVRRLIRRRFGPVSLGELKPAKWRVVTEAELATLRKGRGEKGQETGDRAIGGERPPRRKPADHTAEDAMSSREPSERKPTRGHGFTRFEKLRPRVDGGEAAGRGEKADRGEKAGRGEKAPRGAKSGDRRPAKEGDRPRATAARRGDDKPRRASQRGDEDQRPWEAKKPPRTGKPSARREREEEETPSRGPARGRGAARPAGERGATTRRASGDERPRTRRDQDEEEMPSRGPARSRGAARPAGERGATSRRTSGDERPRAQRDRDAEETPSRGPARDRGAARPAGERGTTTRRASGDERPRAQRDRDEEETPSRGPARGRGAARPVGERGATSRRTSGDERPRAQRDRDAEETPTRGPARSRGAARPTGERGTTSRRASGDDRPRGRRDRDAEETPARGVARGRGERDADRGAKPGKPRGAAPRGEADDEVRGPGYGRRGTTKPGVRAARDREEQEARRPSPRGGGRPGGRGSAAKSGSPARGGGKPGGPKRGASTRDDDGGPSPRGGSGGRPRKGGAPRGRR